jgi:peptide/nickel transport system substrate-binding protein
MRIKTTIAAALALVGASMLVASAFAGTSGTAASSSAAAKKGGTLRINVPDSDFEYVDPGLSYDTLGWSMIYATNMMLANYPEKPGAAGSKLYPEAAEAFPTISKDGKTYVWKIRKGIKFSDGSPVTAAAFKRALERNLSPKMGQGSPMGVNVHMDDLIVGGKAYLEGKAQTLAGVKAAGQVLTVKLTKPDPTFVSILAMQWYSAVKPNTPFTDKGLDNYPAAGPYYIKSRDAGRTLLLERNPNYKGNRPANPDKIVFTANVDVNQSLLQVKAGQSDLTLGLPPTSHDELGKEFGVNKGRYFVGAETCVLYWALNTARAPFNNVAARKAANWGIDRPALVRLSGKYAGKRHDQILVPGVPGYKEYKLYAIKGADPAKAKAVGGSAIKGSVTIFHSTSALATQQAQVVQYNMKQIGFDVKLKPTPGSVYYKTLGTKGVDMDIARAGWCADYNDPFDFINVLLDGGTIQESNNVNFSYLNNASYNAKMAAASKLLGDARGAAYAKLDLEGMRDLAPWTPYMIPNARYLVSSRASNVIHQPYFTNAVFQAIAVG